MKIPVNLISHPCEPVGPGKNTNDLKIAYIKNTGCVGEYKGIIKGLEKYNQKIEEGLNAKRSEK